MIVKEYEGILPSIGEPTPYLIPSENRWLRTARLTKPAP